MVPVSPGGTSKYLRADGTWVAPPDTNSKYFLVFADEDGDAKLSLIESGSLVTSSVAGIYGSGATSAYVMNGRLIIESTDTKYDLVSTSGAGLCPQIPAPTSAFRCLRDNSQWEAPYVYGSTSIHSSGTVTLGFKPHYVLCSESANGVYYGTYEAYASQLTSTGFSLDNVFLRRNMFYLSRADQRIT